MLPPGNVHLFGYFHSYRYLEGLESDIRTKLVHRAKDALSANLNLDAVRETLKLRRQVDALISVHVRVYGKQNPPPQYYANAMNWYRAYFAKRGQRVGFVVVGQNGPNGECTKWVSDQWVFQASDTVVLKGERSLGSDLCLLSRTEHSILSKGSYGWWGAWLAGGLAIYWDQMRNASAHTTRARATSFSADDMYPSTWQPLTGAVEKTSNAYIELYPRGYAVSETNRTDYWPPLTALRSVCAW